jgi:hypothetical protein
VVRVRVLDDPGQRLAVDVGRRYQHRDRRHLVSHPFVVRRVDHHETVDRAVADAGERRADVREPLGFDPVTLDRVAELVVPAVARPDYRDTERPTVTLLHRPCLDRTSLNPSPWYQM